MKKLLLILLCLPMIGFGQGWTKTYDLASDYEYVNTAKQTLDEGYIITGALGNTNGPFTTNNKCILIKTDINGDIIWNKSYTFSSIIYSSLGKDVLQTSDGGYIICGSGLALNAPPMQPVADILLIKTDANGDMIWFKTYPTIGDEGNSVQQTSDGGYIVAGTSYITNTHGDVLLMKTDSLGNVMWDQTYNLSGVVGGYNEGNFVQQTIDGGYVVCGMAWTYPNPNPPSAMRGYLLKTDLNGNQLWSQIFAGTNLNNNLLTVQQTLDTGFILCGWASSSSSSTPDIWVVKTDNSGNQQWERYFDCGSNSSNIGCSAQQTSDGGYIITGGNAGGPLDLIKIDNNGIDQWSNEFDYYNISSSQYFSYTAGKSVQETSDGGYIISTNGTMATYDLASGWVFDDDIALLKTNSTGNTTSTFNIPINPNRKLEKTVDILGRETKPQANTPFIEIYDDGTVEKRIVIE